ncbi:hypothetical protein [Citricoccus sp. GCM10030269]|uniref:hypothetical protein n=1 Tax=Citricoccus sp. GCM10030269 TaxID=3273388 RepID=UPI003607D620
MAMDFDSQLIESVEVRRNRLTTSLLFGANPTERRWKGRSNLLVYGLVVGALICAFCVAISFVIMVLTNYMQEREERERQQQERMDQNASAVVPGTVDVTDATDATEVTADVDPASVPPTPVHAAAALEAVPALISGRS